MEKRVTRVGLLPTIKVMAMKKPQVVTWSLYHFHCFAEDEGFKPPIPGKGYTGFRVQRIRSLCQSSLTAAKVILISNITKELLVFFSSFA